MGAFRANRTEKVGAFRANKTQKGGFTAAHTRTAFIWEYPTPGSFIEKDMFKSAFTSILLSVFAGQLYNINVYVSLYL